MPKEQKSALDYIRAADKAQAIWDAMDENQKTGVRFGMFPAEVMAAAEKEGWKGEKGHDLVCALMDVAKKNGGMRA